MLAAKVGCQNDQRIGKVHRAALTIGQAAVIQHLKQNVENVRMGLFHLVEQHDLIRPAADSLGEHTAFFISHISWRRTDEPCNTVLFHEF